MSGRPASVCLTAPLTPHPQSSTCLTAWYMRQLMREVHAWRPLDTDK